VYTVSNLYLNYNRWDIFPGRAEPALERTGQRRGAGGRDSFHTEVTKLAVIVLKGIVSRKFAMLLLVPL
jgi:hypothetical protein